MTSELLPTDSALLDVLRKHPSATIVALAKELCVTATAVRQRLTRLMALRLVSREASRMGRGRPSHAYRLTDEGQRVPGGNYTDLAVVLWQEIRAIRDPEIRKSLIQRIASRLADSYRDQIKGDSLSDKLASVATLFNERNLLFAVETDPGDPSLPVLKAYACPYPDLARQDRSICSMERMMVAEVVGQPIRLSQCRLDGESCCTFEARAVAVES